MSKQTLFIIISAVIIVLSSAGLIVNSELNKMADGFGIPDLDYYNQVSASPTTGTGKTAPGSSPASGTEAPGSGLSPSGMLAPGSAEQQRLAAEIEARVNRPVSRKDLVKAGIILVGSLSRDELNYVYQVGRKPQPSKEEMIKAREILLNKLSAEDIATLRALGGTYGRSLRILDPNVPIR